MPKQPRRGEVIVLPNQAKIGGGFEEPLLFGGRADVIAAIGAVEESRDGIPRHGV